jgi:hypothetical protein
MIFSPQDEGFSPVEDVLRINPFRCGGIGGNCSLRAEELDTVNPHPSESAKGNDPVNPSPPKAMGGRHDTIEDPPISVPTLGAGPNVTVREIQWRFAWNVSVRSVVSTGPVDQK